MEFLGAVTHAASAERAILLPWYFVSRQQLARQFPGWEVKLLLTFGKLLAPAQVLENA
jgi:hypothetical protein